MSCWCVGRDDTEVQRVGSRRPRDYFNRLRGSGELMGRMRYMKEDAGSLGMHTIWNTTGNEGMGYRDGIERDVNGHKGRPGSGYGREPVGRTLRRLGGDSDRLSGHEYDQHHSNRKSTRHHSTHRAITPFASVSSIRKIYHDFPHFDSASGLS